VRHFIVHVRRAAGSSVRPLNCGVRRQPMSHSKMTRRGKSHYLESWNPSAKRFIVKCGLCGQVGFKPEVLEPSFSLTEKGRVTRRELEAVLKPLAVNAAGMCESCVSVSTK